MINLNEEGWMRSLNSTGVSTPYYTWKTDKFTLKGERPDSRCNLINDQYSELFKGKSVVDIGCNLGRMSHHALSLGANHVHGYEHDEVTCKAATKISQIEGNEDKLTFVHKNLENENIEEDFDVAMCFSVLHHINPRDTIWKFLNENIKDHIIIESKAVESPFQSSYAEGDAWAFKSNEDMISYILSKLTNFTFIKDIGTSERGRPVLLFSSK